MQRTLTDDQVREIRELHEAHKKNPNDGLSMYKLARAHGTSYNTVYLICNGITYRDVPDRNREPDSLGSIHDLMENLK